jgi:hypothetical protein
MRVAEVAGLRVSGMDFIRGVVHPKQQWPAKPLKTDGSDQPIPIPQGLALLLSASVEKYPSEMMVTNGSGTEGCGPWIIERAIRDAREEIDGLPEGFSFHDLQHYLASLLIASGADIRRCRRGCATSAHARRWTPTGTCGPMPMSPPVWRSVPSLPNGWTHSDLLGTHCVPRQPARGVAAGQRV